MKYIREIKPDIKVQNDKIFVRNDLFEQVIKSYKAANTEFTMLKEKLGICLYQENYYTEEVIQIQDNTKVPSIKEINKVSNEKLTKKMTKDADNKSIKVIDKVLINEPDNKSINKPDNKSINELDNSSINKEVNSNTTSWYDTDKFNKILATIDNNNFNDKNKIGKLKFKDINDLINNIKGNTISEADTKKKNELNEIKKVETNSKRLIESQKKLLSLFDDLNTIFNKAVNESNSSTKNETVNESNSNTKNESKSDNESDNESNNERDNESKKDKNYHETKQLNDLFKTIDQSKSLEQQIELLKEKGEFLSENWYVGYYHGNKELNYKIFKTKAACVLNDIADKSFEKIFGYKFATLVDKLINTTSKEENQIIIDDIENNKDKIYEEYKFDESIFKQRGNLHDAVKIILEINELLASDEVNND